ncbi:ATP-dependent (S)-NAD(P)H-hydrate dehydratase-like isoform X2 [Artemia franciscana]|uniref:ATP-dependent (S)-NAD(P)H-hydrate dehydratase n=1 Tax=Artemia franciscana TaxID=6661 RepID=A0AA88KTZ4_ARTSF|nr:hypothetical protein QYM36_014746 [Artemia franciscana]
MANSNAVTFIQAFKNIIPPLGNKLHKGQAGRLAVIGGSLEYTGAPYFAAISALKAGCDLVHVFCVKDAATVIKGYSPELIVHPILDSTDCLEQLKQWLPKFQAVTVGPGLGRQEGTLKMVAEIIGEVRKLDLPMVVDADGLFLIGQRPDLIQNYGKAVLTPNAMEFSRLYTSIMEEELAPQNDPDPQKVVRLARQLGSCILLKSQRDIISDGEMAVSCEVHGSPRRSGGQGDILSGSSMTFLHWCFNCDKWLEDMEMYPSNPAVLATYAACVLTRTSARLAFEKYRRSTTATNAIEHIQAAFEQTF